MKIYRRTSPDMKIDQFKPAIVYTIYIAAPAEKVWQALTTAEFSRQYFSGFAIEADLKISGQRSSPTRSSRRGTWSG